MADGVRGGEQQQREKLLIAQWVSRRYPTAQIYLNQQLGRVVVPSNHSLDDRIAYALAKAHRRKVDALIILRSSVILAEAKIDGSDQAIGQLLVYNELFGATPEFAPYARWPRELVIVSYVHDVPVESVCRRVGIHYIVFTTPELDAAVSRDTAHRRRQFQQGLAQSAAALGKVP